MSYRSNKYDIHHTRDYWSNVRRKQLERYRSRTGSNRFSSKKFTPEEDELVLKHEMPDRELADKLGRSLASIQNRRYRLTHEDNQND